MKVEPDYIYERHKGFRSGSATEEKTEGDEWWENQMQRQSGPSMLLQKMERLSEKQSIAQTAVLVFS